MATQTIPTRPEFDPFEATFLADPYPFFAAYRQRQPVFHSPALDYWVLARYADVRAAFRDTSLYSAANALSPIQPRTPRAAGIMAEGFGSVPTLTNTDPPVHTRARRIANVAFTPRMVAAMEPFIREMAIHLIEDRLQGGQADIVRALTWELPALVIFKVLGVPDEDVPQVKSWAGNRLIFMFGRTDDPTQEQVAEGMVAFWRYTETLVADRTINPRQDFTTELVQAVDAEGERLRPEEVATVLFGLLLAGHETTTNLLSNGVRRFLEHRANAWEALCAEPGLIPNAVEEVLRFDPSVVMWRRKTKVPVTISGVDVPADANLLLLIGSANRDKEMFSDPERFDIRRANAREHLSFGMGNHLCLGAPLARLEARVVFEELTRRRPGLTLLPEQRLAFHPNISFRGPSSLEVRWS
ncbi:MAG: cytochrome P450 [Chloroflexi bacterium]|nr:cytochrome P450 [Chloroflexota bacterium]